MNEGTCAFDNPPVAIEQGHGDDDGNAVRRVEERRVHLNIEVKKKHEGFQAVLREPNVFRRKRQIVPLP